MIRTLWIKVHTNVIGLPQFVWAIQSTLSYLPSTPTIHGILIGIEVCQFVPSDQSINVRMSFNLLTALRLNGKISASLHVLDQSANVLTVGEIG